MADVAKIAAGLTEGQVKVLRSSEATVDGRVLVPSMLGNLNGVIGWPKGMTRFYSAYYSSLTPLGLAVRQHLMEQANG